LLPVVPPGDDDPAEGAWTRAQAYRSRGDLPKAAAELRSALQIRPDYAVAHLVLGEVLDQLGDRAGTLECYRQAVACDGRWPKALNRLAVALRRSGDPAGAQECLQRALQLDPDHFEAKFNYALELHRSGQVREATQLYRSLLQQRPDAGTSRNLAIGLVALGEHAEAAAVLRTALAVLPGDEALSMHLARLYSASPDASVRNAAEGLTLARRAAAVAPQPDADVEDTLAIALAANGQFEQALATARRALALAERDGRQKLCEAIQRRIEQFARGEAYRD
jgi:tetratricopeptide (TPR) repeat protein